MKRSKPVLAVVGAGVAWGVISLFVRGLSAAGLGPLQISLIRMVTAALCFFPLQALRAPEKLRIRLRDIWCFLGSGICSILLFYTCYFHTIAHASAAAVPVPSGVPEAPALPNVNSAVTSVPSDAQMVR